MASLQTAIELTDHFSVPIYNMINSMNLAISSVYDMQQAMNSDISTTCIDTAREELNQATIALDEFNRAMQDMAGAGITAPVVPDIAEPIQIPVEWQTDSMEVFTSSGMERFVQEAQSVNNAMEQLSMTQNEIARQAFNTNILPPQAAQDMNAMAVRIDNIRNRIIQIENNPMSLGTGMANNELEQLRMQLNQAITQQNTLNSAIERMDVAAANTAYRQLSGTIGNTERYIRDNVYEQGTFNQTIAEGIPKAQNLVQALMGLQMIQSLIRMIENQLDSAMNRMDTMTNFSRTMTAITRSADLADASLQMLKETTTGTAYGLDTAAAAVQNFTTRGMQIGAATLEVGKWADAVAFYGDGTNETLTSVTDAIGKMLTKGTVEMDQLNRLTDAGINAVGIYAQATGQAAVDVQNNLSDGVISAQNFITTVSTAFAEGTNGVLNISGAAKEAGATWATSTANAKAAVTRGIISMIDYINGALTNAGFGTILDGVTQFGATAEVVLGDIGSAAGTCITIMSPLLHLIVEVPQFISDNWSVISPLIYGVAAAMLFYIAVLGIYNTVQAISIGIQAVSAAHSAFKAGATLAEAATTITATGAQAGFNAALLACPITWIVIAIIALIAILVALCAHVAKTGETATTTFGVICGALNVVKTAFVNLAIDAVNGFLGIGMAVDAVGYNIMAAFTNSFNRSQSVVYTFTAVALTAIAKIAEALDNLPFVDASGWTSGLTAAANEYAGKAAEAYGNQKDYKNVADAYMEGATTFERQDYSKAYADGAKWGDNVTAKFKDMAKGINIPDPNDYKNALDSSNMAANVANAANNTDKTAGNSSKIAKQLEITSEDLKYLRDMAEQDVINRFTTAEIKVDVTNHNNINSDVDFDGVTEHLRMTIEDQMAAAAEGVY